MKRRCIIAMLALVPACDFSRVSAPDPDAGIPDGPSNTRTPPRLVSPVANAYTGAFPSGAPTRFSWTPGTGPVSSWIVEIASSADFAVNLTRVETTAQHVDVNLAPTFGNNTVPVGRRLYWRVKACVGADCSSMTKTRILNFGRSNRDLNGDGYADIAIGTPYSIRGKVSVYFGGSTGPDQTVDGTLSGTTDNDLFGLSLASSGDFNGDGFADLIVGAPGNPAVTADGSFRVFLGGPGTSFDPNADFTITSPNSTQLGYRVTSVGDFNGDGYDDFAISSPQSGNSKGDVNLFFGAPTLSTPDSITLTGVGMEQVGYSLASAGDFNNDGFSDLLVGTALNKVYLFLGSNSPSYANRITLTSSSSAEAFGTAASAGDINGDGFSDVLIGAPSNSDNSMTAAGRAYLFMGRENPPSSINNPSFIFSGAAAMARLGSSVSASGDLNRDGFADLVIGVRGSQDSGAGSNTGSTFIYFGGTTFNTISDGKIVGAPNENLGAAVSTVGDVNGDSFDDLLVGTDTSAQPLGRAYLYRGGSSTQFDASADNIYTGTVNNAGFGSSIARAVPRSLHSPRFPQCSATKT